MRPRKADRHLPPCVYEKHGAYWLVKKGKWTRLGATLSEALLAYAGTIETGGKGMVQLVDKVYAHHSPKLAENTRHSYTLCANKLKTVFADFEPQQIKGKHVAALKLSMADHPSRANHTLSFLKVVFQYALEWQLVESNPCIGIRPYTLVKRSRYLTDQEFLAIHAVANPVLQLVMDLCYLTGQRVGDVLTIQRRDLKEDGIHFQAAKTKNSTGARVVVSWSPELRAVVERARQMNPGVIHLTLLVGKHKKPLTYRSVIGYWWQACKAAEVKDAHIHDMRAKSATDAEAQGLNPQILLGHATAAMTERYIRRRQTPVISGPAMKKESGK